MNKTEKVALREAVIVVLMGAVINFPLQTYLLWLTIDNWQWADPIKISIFVQLIITVVALIRVYAIRMRFQRGNFLLSSFSFLPFFFSDIILIFIL